ncbi:MAG TPA: AAA family ATPase [Actinomycetota bacterium]|nr:AAA family ATPase [Actinomycetota bacterium]
MPPFGLTGVHVRGFRSLKDTSFRPGTIAAIVGEQSAGKSNLLTAIWALLDPTAAPLEANDVPEDDQPSTTSIRIVGELADGSTISVTGMPPGPSSSEGPARPPALFFPAGLRDGTIVAPPGPGGSPHPVVELIRAAVDRTDAHGSSSGTTASAHGLVAGLESWREAAITGLIVLMEEPELFLPPQAQRYLYRLLRTVAAQGNQILYSTHSPAFLNVVRLDELVFTERRPRVGTLLLQPEPLPADDEFRAFSEFDSSRSELFLARAAILVEGLTEKLTLPFVFEALGHDPDRERISIIECGGKGNIPLFGKISRAVGLPFVAVYDRDAPEGVEPSHAEGLLNALIAEVAGEDRVELAPDFEGVAEIHGDRQKPARAWRRFADLGADAVPAPLAEVVERAIALAGRGPG